MTDHARPANPSRLVVSDLDGDPTYVTSTRSNGQGQCVAIATDGQQFEVLDSKNPTGPTLRFDAAAWAAFTGAVKARKLPLT